MLDYIPIYRVKKKDSDEYIEGVGIDGNLLIQYIFQRNSHYEDYTAEISEIDTTTLSIHFPNMLASDSNRYFSNGEKDLRIFASLQKDGKGGDILGDVRIKFCQEEFIFKIQPIGYSYWNKINSSIFYFFGHSIIKGIQE